MSVDRLEARAKEITKDGLNPTNDASLEKAKEVLTTALNIWSQISDYKGGKATVNISIIRKELNVVGTAIEAEQAKIKEAEAKRQEQLRQEEAKQKAILRQQEKGRQAKLEEGKRRIAGEKREFTTTIINNAMMQAEKVAKGSGKFPAISGDVFDVIHYAVDKNWSTIQKMREEIKTNPTIVATIANAIKQEKEIGRRTGDVVFKKSASINDMMMMMNLVFTDYRNATGPQNAHGAGGSIDKDNRKQSTEAVLVEPSAPPAQEDTSHDKDNRKQSTEAVLVEPSAPTAEASYLSMPLAQAIPVESPPIAKATAYIMPDKRRSPDNSAATMEMLDLPEAPVHPVTSPNARGARKAVEEKEGKEGKAGAVLS